MGLFVLSSCLLKQGLRIWVRQLPLICYLGRSSKAKNAAFYPVVTCMLDVALLLLFVAYSPMLRLSVCRYLLAIGCVHLYKCLNLFRRSLCRPLCQSVKRSLCPLLCRFLCRFLVTRSLCRFLCRWLYPSASSSPHSIPHTPSSPHALP